MCDGTELPSLDGSWCVVVEMSKENAHGLFVTLSEVWKSWKMRWNFWKQRENINLPGTWLYKVLQPSLFSSSILSFGEQSPEKGELRTKKWQTSPMLLTETYKDRPLDGPQGLLAWICPPSSRIWEKRPKMNLTSVVLMILRTLTLNSTKCKAHPTANKVVYDLSLASP